MTDPVVTKIEWYEYIGHVGPVVLGVIGMTVGLVMFGFRNLFATRAYVDNRIQHLDERNTNQHEKIEGKVDGLKNLIIELHSKHD